jgi:hypothetical protein
MWFDGDPSKVDAEPGFDDIQLAAGDMQCEAGAAKAMSPLGLATIEGMGAAGLSRCPL